MNCPLDGTTLVIADRQGIEIDYCPKCRGVWLDRGELDKLIERAAVAEGRYTPPAPDRAPVRGEAYREYDDDDYKPKNDDYYRDANRPYPQDRDYPQGNSPQGRRKKSFLGEVFDIFD